VAASVPLIFGISMSPSFCMVDWQYRLHRLPNR